MARTKRKRVASPGHPRPRPLWFDGLSPQDLNHVMSLIDMGMDTKRTSRSKEISRHLSSPDYLATTVSSAQTGSPQAQPQAPLTAAIQDTSHVDKEQDGGLAFTKIVFFEVYPIEPSLVDTVHPTRRNSAVSDHSSIKSVSLRCHECHRTCLHSHQLLAHYWYRHIKKPMLASLAKPGQDLYESLARELIDLVTLVEDIFGFEGPDTPAPEPHLPSVRVLSDVFAHWFNIEFPSELTADSRIPGLPASLESMRRVIAPSVDGSTT